MVDHELEPFAQRLAQFRPAGEAATLERALNRLAEQSASDHSLRLSLQEQATHALSRYGILLPPTMRVVWHEQRPGHCDLILPLAELQADDWTPQVYSVLCRATADAAFAAELLARPKAAIERVLGLRLPSTMNVTAWRNSLSELHIILPEDDLTFAEQDSSGEELSDAELELITGGGAGPVAWLRFGGRIANSAG